MLAGGLRPLPGRLVTDSRSALGARRARPHATPFAQQHLKFHGPPNSGRSVAEWAPSLKKATGASRPSLQQRLPGAEGPPEGRSTAPRHAACGGPIPSARGPVLIFALRPRWRPLRASVAGSLLAARPWPAVQESRLPGVLRRPAPGFRPRRLLSGALVTRCSPLSFKRRPDTTPLVGRHDQAGRHLS